MTERTNGRLGICAGPSWGCSVSELVEAAALAEQRGFARLTTGEYRSDPFAWLAVLSGATRTLHLGTTIASISTRHPIVAAEAVAALVDTHGPRYEPAFGVSHRVLNDELGLPQPDLNDLADYVRCVRAALLGREASHGRFRVPATDRDRVGPPTVPLLVAALGVKATRRALQFADGVVLTWTPEAQVRAARDEIRRSEDAGKRLRVVLPTFPNEDPGIAEAACGRALHAYLGLPAYRRMMVEALGDAERVEAAASGPADGVAAVLGPAALGSVAALGPRHRIDAAVERQLAAGADDVVLYPLDAGAGWRGALRTVLEQPVERWGM